MKPLISILVLLCCAVLCFGQQPFVVQEQAATVDFGFYTWSGSDALDTNRVKALPSDRWQLEEKNSSLSSEPQWLLLHVVNGQPVEQLTLELAYPVIDNATLYRVDSSGLAVRLDAVTRSAHVTEREIPNAAPSFQLNLPKGDTALYLLSVQNIEEVIVPLRIGPSQEMMYSWTRRNLVGGLYLGIIGIMIVYNLVLFFMMRDVAHVYYVGYILFVLLIVSGYQGYTYEFLWGGWSWMARNEILVSVVFSGVFGNLFFQHFTQSAKHTPIMHVISKFVIAGFLSCLVFCIFGDEHTAYLAVNFVGIVSGVNLTKSSITSAEMGYRPAKYFLISQSIFLLGCLIFILRSMGIVPHNSFSFYVLEVGSAIDAGLLSLALADKINALKQEKDLARKAELKALEEHQKLITHQNVLLAQQVEEKTRELTEQNVELQETYYRLKDAKSRMETLGQITAGIAHDIANPLQSMSFSVEIIEKQTSDAGKKWTGKLKSAIEQCYSVVDRLRSYTRMGGGHLTAVNLSQSFEMVLGLLQHKIKGTQLTLNIAHDHVVMADQSLLVQALLNLLNNAIEATREQSLPAIQCSSTMHEDWVICSISDNGHGIDDQIIHHIWDPFYTSKSDAGGTGLGLAQVKDAIHQMGGNIEVNSQVGSGCTFTVSLPSAVQELQAV